MDITGLSQIGFGDTNRSELDVIKTNLLLNAADKKTITMLASAWSDNVPKLTVQLTESFALGQRKVLLVNADDKNAAVLEAGVSAASPEAGVDDKAGTDNVAGGLYGILAGTCSLDSCVCGTDIPGLSYLPAGAQVANGADLLGGVGFEKLLEDLKKQYDMIFLLVPAAADSTDGITAARSTDGCVMIVSSNTAYGKIARAVTMLKKGTTLIGTVLIKDKNPWMPVLPLSKHKK